MASPLSRPPLSPYPHFPLLPLSTLVVSGKTLVGKLSLGQLHNGSGAAPVGLPLVYVVPPPKPSPDKVGASDDKATTAAKDKEGGGMDIDVNVNAAEEALNISLRDAKIKFLKVRREDGASGEGGKGPEGGRRQPTRGGGVGCSCSSAAPPTPL